MEICAPQENPKWNLVTCELLFSNICFYRMDYDLYSLLRVYLFVSPSVTIG
jgi:hypothetical protein